MKVLEVEGLSCSYGENKVLEEISFSISEGEILGIVGESGSGKSTIFHSILGLKKELKVNAGKILFREIDFLHMPPENKVMYLGDQLGTVFQNSTAALVPTRRIGKQFEETVRAKKNWSKKEIKKRAISLFQLLRLKEPERIYRAYSFELSGGMQQRVAIALAFILEPKILLCDEPTSALDARVEYEIVQELARLRRNQGVAMMMITHNLALAMALCDKIVVLKDGKIVESGSTDEVIANPRAEYTKELLEAVPRLGKRKIWK